MGGDDRLRDPDALEAYEVLARNLDRMVADARSVLGEYSEVDATFVMGAMILKQIQAHPTALTNAVAILALATIRLAEQQDPDYEDHVRKGQRGGSADT